MKKYPLLALLLFVIGGSFCYSQKNQNPYMSVGEQHNTLVQEFYESQFKAKDWKSATEWWKSKGVEKVKGNNFIKVVLEDKTMTVKEYVSSSELFTKKQKNYLNQVLDLIGDEPALSELQVKVMNDTDLNENQRMGIQSAIAIANSSYQYWTSNLDLWVDDDNGTIFASAEDVVAADVAAGAVAAQQIGAGLLIPGVGQTAAGIIAASSAAASAVVAAVYIGGWVLDKVGENGGWW